MSVIVWLQIFNWFSIRWVGTIFALLLLIEAAVNMFMSSMAVDEDKQWLWNTRYLLSGLFMFALALVDYRTFKFYPLEADIFLD